MLTLSILKASVYVCVCVCILLSLLFLRMFAFSVLPSVFGRFFHCFSSFSLFSRLTSLLDLLFHPSLAFSFLTFPFIIVLLHPSADNLSWEAAGWRWACVETNLLIPTTARVEETLLSEESHQPRLASGVVISNDVLVRNSWFVSRRKSLSS